MSPLVLGVALALPACGSDPVAGADAADTVADVKHDSVGPPPSPWTVHVIEDRVAGRQIQAAVLPDGTPVVAAYLEDGADSGDPCDPNSATGGEQIAWTLQYATPSAADLATWSVEEVAHIVHLGAPRGFDLAIAPDGTPTIAALTGPVSLPPVPYCGANDVGIYRRSGGTWAVATAVANSNEAATGEPASDFGNVVGLWPALAFDAQGNAFVAYKDVHGGGLQGDDFTRADLESAWASGAGWRHLPIDWGKGAGDFSAAAFDKDGRPLVLAFNPRDDLQASERGLWLYRSDDDGATWKRVRLFSGGIGERPSLAVAGDGSIWVAWYDGSLGLPYVAHLSDPELFETKASWDIGDIGDHVFDEGRHPSIAVSAHGVVGVAYQRCGRASDGIGDCNPSKDAVVFAWQDGAAWEREVVEDEPNGLCGNFATLVFSGESAVVFYQCLVQQGDEFVSALRAAKREAL
ncbi:MAG: sialidase family protein [Myxococcota bacterium]